MKREKLYCQSCEIKFIITVTDSNYDSSDDVEILYCPVCSAEFIDESDMMDLMDYMNGEDNEE
jgi:Zn-finger nucleic acid-binding protein